MVVSAHGAGDATCDMQLPAVLGCAGSEAGDAELFWRVSSPALTRLDNKDLLDWFPETTSSGVRTDSVDQTTCGLRDPARQGQNEYCELSATAAVAVSNHAGATGNLEALDSTDMSGSSDSTEHARQRKLAQNREYQRRFRIKRKVRCLQQSHGTVSCCCRVQAPAKGASTLSPYNLQAQSQAVQAELAATTARLQQLQHHRQHTDLQRTPSPSFTAPIASTSEVTPLPSLKVQANGKCVER